jgi:hypothetical protein
VSTAYDAAAARRLNAAGARLKVELVSKKKDGSDLAAIYIAAVLISAVYAALLMLGFSAAHDLWAVIPPAGYLACFQLTVGLEAIGGALHQSARKLST